MYRSVLKAVQTENEEGLAEISLYWQTVPYGKYSE